jgi:hypothetical protein
MSEPVTLYCGGSTMVVYAPGEVSRLLGQGWALEPEPVTVTPIPNDFPGAGDLRAAGLLTLEDVAVEPDLTGIKGVGRVTARRIREALDVLL